MKRRERCVLLVPHSSRTSTLILINLLPYLGDSLINLQADTTCGVKLFDHVGTPLYGS